MEQKTKRIKRVYSNSEQVIHLWANQSQSDARSRNVFFEGTEIYSYGRHYLLGEILEFNGVKVAMINDSGYSITTSGHINSAWHSVSHMPRLKFNKIGVEYIKPALISWQDSLIEILFKDLNRLKFSEYSYWGLNFKHFNSDYVMQAVKEFNKTATLLGFKELVLEVPDYHFELLNSYIKARIDRNAQLTSPEAQAKRDELKAKRQAKALAAMQDDIKAWLAGGPITSEIRALKPQIVRVIGDRVQSNRGAEVTLKQARAFLTALKDSPTLAGVDVGGFRFMCLNGDILTIGCHHLSLKQVTEVLNSANTLTLVG